VINILLKIKYMGCYNRDLFDGMHERKRSSGRSNPCRSFVLFSLLFHL
jgi:hypothetical protein